MQNEQTTKPPRPRCHNCKHAGETFKIDCLTHLHCQHPDRVATCQGGWDTLQEWWDTCDNHEYKTNKIETNERG